MGFSGLCRASGARSRDAPRAGARRRESQTGAGAKRRQGRPSRIRVSDTRERSKPRERLRIVRGAKPRALFPAFPRRRSLGEATQHQETPGVSPGTVRPENASSLGEAAQSRAGARRRAGRRRGQGGGRVRPTRERSADRTASFAYPRFRYAGAKQAAGASPRRPRREASRPFLGVPAPPEPRRGDTTQETPGVSPGTVRPENASSLGEAAQSRAGAQGDGSAAPYLRLT